MANPKHLKILKRGEKAWNKWRGENPGIFPDLEGANLRAAQLCEADLRGAKLFKVDLIGVDLLETYLEGADLRGAYLMGAVLRAAHLENSDFTNAQMYRTVFGDNDLSTVKGLETVEHLGPSTIGIDTIYKSKGNIPEVFLRGAGVPEEFIVYMRSLVGKAIDFYSCFLSYSSKDDDFAQRLHADLQQKGVRCWFAPEDLKIGDKFRTRIDESIRIYDKLMVILSENSIRSPWVEDEVEAALEKERKKPGDGFRDTGYGERETGSGEDAAAREKERQKPGDGFRDTGHGQGGAALEKERKPGNTVLFPIRLDDAVMDTGQAWAASLRRTRHIGDFRAWKDHDQYQKSFERLLRDLKA